MKLILLSGGSGKRLWPLSNTQRSKQFIKVLTSPSGNLESMVQRVWRQLEEIDLAKDTFVATSYNQESILKSQIKINNNQVIIEPCRRDTFSAIALACSYFSSEMNISDNETIVVLPVDPFVEIDFFIKLKELEQLLVKKDTTLGLIGINPELPSEKYGYIIPNNSMSDKVSFFQEKPSKELAKLLIEKGAVWNAGVFGFKLSTILDTVRNLNLEPTYSFLNKNYDKLPANSFDYEFTEKQSGIRFLKYNGFWKDLGTWNTLTEEMSTKTVGGPSEMIDSKNTHVINDTSLPIAVIGAESLVVAAGPEGILISTKESSPRIKEIRSDFFESVSYFEEEWGKKKVLYRDKNISISMFSVFDGGVLKLSSKPNQKIFKLSGIGEIKEESGYCCVKGLKNFTFIISTEKKI